MLESLNPFLFISLFYIHYTMSDLNHIVLSTNDENDESDIPQTLYIQTDKLVPTLKSCNKINILSLNVQCLNAKLDQLKIFLYNLSSNNCIIDVICLQETWLSPECDTNYFNIDGYTLVSQPAHCSSHGGVCMYISNNINYKIIPLHKNSHIWDGQFLELNFSKKIILGNLYRPPADVHNNYDTFFNELEPILGYLKSKSCDVILSGDFNIDLLKINEKPKVQEFCDLMYVNNFLPKINKPTRLGHDSQSIIDNFFCNTSLKGLKSPTFLVKSQISDHLPCILTLNNNNSPISPPKYVNIVKNYSENLKTFMSRVESTELLNSLDQSDCADPNSNTCIIVKILQDLKRDCFSIKHVKFDKHRHKNQRWITKGIIKSIHFRDKMYSKLKRTISDTVKYNILKTNLKTYNKILKDSIIYAKHKYYNDCLERHKIT